MDLILRRLHDGAETIARVTRHFRSELPRVRLRVLAQLDEVSPRRQHDESNRPVDHCVEHSDNHTDIAERGSRAIVENHAVRAFPLVRVSDHPRRKSACLLSSVTLCVGTLAGAIEVVGPRSEHHGGRRHPCRKVSQPPRPIHTDRTLFRLGGMHARSSEPSARGRTHVRDVDLSASAGASLRTGAAIVRGLNRRVRAYFRETEG